MQGVHKTPFQLIAGSPAMQKAKIRRIACSGQPGQKSLQDPISMKKAGYGGAHLLSQLQQEAYNKRFQANLGESDTLSPK
jgi:hypothetical protein